MTLTFQNMPPLTKVASNFSSTLSAKNTQNKLWKFSIHSFFQNHTPGAMLNKGFQMSMQNLKLTWQDLISQSHSTLTEMTTEKLGVRYLIGIAIYSLYIKSVKCYHGGRKINLISSISEIQSQNWYHCIQYTKRHQMRLFSHC